MHVDIIGTSHPPPSRPTRSNRPRSTRKDKQEHGRRNHQGFVAEEEASDGIFVDGGSGVQLETRFIKEKANRMNSHSLVAGHFVYVCGGVGEDLGLGIDGEG